MKSYTQRIGRALLISLVLHLSIAIALMFVTFTKVDNKREMPFLSVSFIKLESQKTLIPRVAPLVPPVQPISPSKLKSGDFSHQFLPTVTSPKSRSNITGVSKSSSELVANVTPTSHGVRLGAADLPVTNQAVAQDKTSALAHLPTEPSAVESRQLKSELAFGETGAAGSEVGQGQDSNINKQRGVFPKGVQVESTSAKMSGIGSLVSKSQVANEDDVLADITDNVVLGGEIPSLPKGEPGGIIVGRGNDIKGRLNLVRLNDPLHPSLYGWGQKLIGSIQFGAGLPYLVKAMNQLTNIKTRLESPIKLTDASLFKAPLLFMEPIAGATQNIGQAASDKALWQARTMSGVDKYTDAEAENLRKYIVERGGFMYMLTHGNTPIAMRSAQKVLREILPEYPLRIVSNDHEIYRSFFSLGGPLRFPLREDTCAAYSLHLGPYSELKGVFVGDRLAILVDTESMMHILDAAAQHPFTGGYANYNKLMDELAPHAARQMINIIVYAMTHGSISDYSHYVPTKTADSSEALPTAPNSTMSKTAPVGR